MRKPKSVLLKQHKVHEGTKASAKLVYNRGLVDRLSGAGKLDQTPQRIAFSLEIRESFVCQGRRTTTHRAERVRLWTGSKPGGLCGL